jgi:hypothetical protein
MTDSTTPPKVQTAHKIDAPILTVKDALARIPDKEVENIALAIMDELYQLEIPVYDDENREKVLKVIKQELWHMVDRALWALEPVTIVADPEDEEAA